MPATARAMIMGLAAFALTACQEDSAQSGGTDLSSPPLQLSELQKSCEDDGGTWGARGSALFICYMPTSDANQLCRVASDCESVCLARSRTCAPTTPFLGCHDVLTEGGQRATQCTN